MWTKEFPTKSGYYWMIYINPTIKNPPEICEISDEGLTVDGFYYPKNDEFVNNCIFWSEPIVPPITP